MTAVPTTKKIVTERKLILPPADFDDDEELLEWFEACRLITFAASDELEEDSAHVYAVLRNYCIRQGMGRFAANRTARAVALPITRAAESMENTAKYFRTGSRAAEALVEATTPRRRNGEFHVKRRG